MMAAHRYLVFAGPANAGAAMSLYDMPGARGASPGSGAGGADPADSHRKHRRKEGRPRGRSIARRRPGATRAAVPLALNQES